MKPLHRSFSISLTFLIFWAGCGGLDLKQSGISPKNKLNRDAPFIYVALGDSTGIGFGGENGGYVHLISAHIQQKYPSAQLINLSIPGATTADIIREMKRSPIEQATVATVSIGINDIMQGVGHEQFARNYEAILSALEKTTQRIVITNLPNISLAPAVPKMRQQDLASHVMRFNRQIEVIAKRHNLPLVDLYQISNSIIELHPDFFSADGFHPSDTGYGLWTDAMWPAIEQIIE